MTHASVFSGIGGPEVAASMLGWENVFHCEINPFGRYILEYWYPNSDSYEDITTTNFKQYRGKIDVLTGGFPCQPFSYAGKRAGAEDDRYLWPQMLRVIDEVRPTWFVGENVNGIRTMVEQGSVVEMGCETALFQEGNSVYRYEWGGEFTIERICRNLVSVGYSVQPIVIPACAVGAPHRRDRVFFVAHSNRSADMRVSGEDAGESREERVQERNEVRESDKSSDVRRVAENPLCCGCICGPDDKQWRERDERNIGARDGKRVCGAENARASSNSECIGWNKREYAVGYLEKSSKGKCREKQLCGADGAPLTECWRGFPSVPPVHRGNDGLPFPVDNLTISLAKWRTESLKAYGNAIVPQVMYEIFRAIEQVEHGSGRNRNENTE